MADRVNAYEEIAKLLLTIAPHDAKILVYSFFVDADGTFEEGAVYRYEFDYVNQNDEINWLDDEKCFELMSLLTPPSLEVRAITETENAKWKSMKFQIDLEKQSFKAEFSY